MNKKQSIELKYNENGVFRIVQMTDTHIGNMPFNEEDYKTFDLIKKVLTEIEADLVIHTGDIIWSEGVKDADIVFYKTMEEFEKYLKIPMAITFGNHDTEEVITRNDLRAIYNDVISLRPEKKHTFMAGDFESYILEIKGRDSTVKNAIFIMDSGDYSGFSLSTYDWVKPEQVDWFREKSLIYKQGDKVKRNLIFQHIPIPEYWNAAENIIAGVNYETNESISAPKINTGLFANMVISEETWGIFVGHDHDNNFEGVLHDIHLVYGNVSGYNTYGELSRGIRIIELSENNKEIKTYTINI